MAAWKTLILTKASSLSVRNGALVAESDGDCLSFACEDVSSVVVEHPAVTVTVAALLACAEAGVAVFVCDARHLPATVSLPLFGHWKQASISQAQLGCPERVRAGLWRNIIKAKITNQAAATRNARSRRILMAISARAKADADRDEARAGRVYWAGVGDGFRRVPGEGKDWRNAALDYGYAILLGHIARAIIAAGLISQLGLHHRGRTNNFNLASDLMEPFRPLVDRVVFAVEDRAGARSALERDDRRTLLAIGRQKVWIAGTAADLPEAARLTAVSLRDAMVARDGSLLHLPELHTDDHVDIGVL